jgi:hypothetical protein
MSCPGREALDACAAGELGPAPAAAVEAHAAECVACGRRLAWLHRENGAIRAWAGAGEEDVERRWGGVRARITQPGWRRKLPVAIAACVAAGALIADGLQEKVEAEQTPSAAAAMVLAEREYTGAIHELETLVATRERQGGRQEPALGRARSGLALARASAGDDPAARVRLLEGYAAYLKSLRRVLREEGL